MSMETSTYTVSMDFRHEGEMVAPGDTVKLTEEEARQRIADGHVRPGKSSVAKSGPKGDPKTGSNAADASARS
jgi:hypothetical protein